VLEYYGNKEDAFGEGMLVLLAECMSGQSTLTMPIMPAAA
jgi:hypothetical protein